MSVLIPALYVQQFSTNIQLLLQQKGSRLRSRVMSMGGHVGEQASPVDQFGLVEMQAVVGRFQPMGRTDGGNDRRWVFPSDYDLNQMVDNFDKLRLLIDPMSSYVQNAVNAAGRKYDDLIIQALFADAKTGQKAATTTTFPAGNIISRTHGASSATGLTVAKLREARRRLMANEVDLESDPLTCVINSIQHDNLLAEAQIISLDYNSQPVLVDGKITRFLGIDFVHSERLAVDTANSDRMVPLFAKSGMYLGIWDDMTTKISERPDIQGVPFQAYVKMTSGATRLEEGKIMQILCDE